MDGLGETCENWAMPPAPVLPPGFATRLVPLPDQPTPLGRLDFAGSCHDTRGTGLQRMRVHGVYALVYLLDGGGRYRDTLGTDRRLAPGDLILVFPELGHQYGPEGGERWRELYVCFHGTAFDQWRRSGLLQTRHPVWHLEPLAYWRDRMLALAEADRPAIVLAARIHQFLADAWAATAASRGGQDWLDTARRLLETLSADHRPALAAVARRCGLHYETFRKRFRAATGLSPGAWRRRALWQRASELLARGDLTLAELAERLGFYDAFHFSREFKRATGVSPRDWRRAPPGQPVLRRGARGPGLSRSTASLP
jgi:AraC-like DNA-binding protein